MDKHTWGDSQAAVNLANTLNAPEFILFSRTVAKLLSKYQSAIKPLLHIPQKDARETALKMFRDKYINHVADANLPEIIKSHVCCVMVGFYRKMLASSKMGILLAWLGL